jgi:hypothetical protein
LRVRLAVFDSPSCLAGNQQADMQAGIESHDEKVVYGIGLDVWLVGWRRKG